jgi:hypothetical protein
VIVVLFSAFIPRFYYELFPWSKGTRNPPPPRSTPFRLILSAITDTVMRCS